VRRARPLLGTYVEIEAQGLADPVLEPAIDAAFGAISRVQRLMSFHDPDSDLSRLNRRAAWEPVAVDRWTATVLRRAKAIFDATGGLFDCAVGYELMQRGVLPPEHLGHVAAGTFSAVRFLPENRIRFAARIAIDLGGIAKGYAVDRAIAVLRAHDVREAIVNAGGDIRVMGDKAQPIHVRCPDDSGRLIPAGLLQNGAIATSSADTTVSRRAAAPSGTPRNTNAYSVVAPTCLLADALTKVLVQTGDAGGELFARFGAVALITPSDGTRAMAA
jgi:thiamine biosynthesis lipoprotein